MRRDDGPSMDPGEGLDPMPGQYRLPHEPDWHELLGLGAQQFLVGLTFGVMIGLVLAVLLGWTL